MTRYTAVAGAVAVAGAYLCLSRAFFSHDFSLVFVTDHSNFALPLGYRLAAVWSGYEGALLLWLLSLHVWTLVWVTRNGVFPAAIARRVNGLLALMSIGFLSALLTWADPFRRLEWIPLDGEDLSPLLQDPAMAFHPPLLIIGYAGICVPFALVCALLSHGGLAHRWFGSLRSWVISAWLFLTLGISLGSWWSYYELGWGGWWSWDPINSVAFMPWLVLTALIHSLAVAERDGLFTGWCVGLVISAFALSLIGSFASRSGMLNSVHNFIEASSQNVMVAAYFAVMIGAAVILALRHRSKFPVALMARPKPSILSRDNFVLTNNIFLSVAAALIFIGTFAPLVLQTLGTGSVSVDRQYFDTVMGILMLPVLAIAGLAMPATVRIRRRLLAATLPGPVVMAVVAGLGWAGFYYGTGSILTVVGVCLAIWLVLSSVLSAVNMTSEGNARLMWRRSGMIIAHLGLALFVLGITISASFSQQTAIRMTPGQTLNFADFRLRLDGQENIVGVNYSAIRASVSVRDGDNRLEILHPEKRTYGAMTSVLSEVAISSDWRGDLFLALGDDAGGGAWIVMLRYQPLVRLIWVGLLLVFLGGLLALVGRSRTIKRVTTEFSTEDSASLIRAPHERRAPITAALAMVGTAIIVSGLYVLTDNQRPYGPLSGRMPPFSAMEIAQNHLVTYRYSAAQKAFADILITDPNNSFAKLGWVQASLAIDHKALLGDAGRMIGEVLVDLPDDPGALWYGAKAAQSNGDLQLAYARWNRLMNLAPTLPLRLAITEQLAAIERRWQNDEGADE